MEKDVKRKAWVIKEVGAYSGWDGAALPEEYIIVSERLEIASLDAESKIAEEGQDRSGLLFGLTV